MTARTIAVISAGLRQSSATRLLADQLAAATERALVRAGDDVTIDVIELRDHAHDITNHVLTGFAGTELSQVIDSVTHADALIVATPIFSASYSGLFKMFFDVLEKDAIAGKPVLIAATAGTARHSLALEHALRPLFAYHRSVIIPTSVFAATEDWGTAGADRALAARIERAAGELAALVDRAPASAPADPFADVVPFDQLLARP